MDGALGLLLHLGRSLEVYLPWILGSIAFLIGAALACRLRLKYLNAKLTEEYAFRREVLAKTGVIIVDKGSMPLPPGEYTHAALPAGVETALPQADETVIDVTSYSPAEQEAFSTEQDAAKAEISPDIISDSAHGTEKPDLVAENSSASSGDTLRHSRQI